MHFNGALRRHKKTLYFGLRVSSAKEKISIRILDIAPTRLLIPLRSPKAILESIRANVACNTSSVAGVESHSEVTFVPLSFALYFRKSHGT